MKKLMMFALVAVLVSGATSALALGPLDVEAELPVYSKYVWRGMVGSDDYVLQPSIALGLFGFKLGVWGNYELTDINSSELLDTKGEFTEVDYTLGWAMTLPKLELGAGFIYYDFPKMDGAETAEFYLGAKVGVILNPSLYVYQDIDAFKGAYWDARISHGFALGETNQLNLSAGVGLGSESYIGGYFGRDGVFIPDTELGASFTDGWIRADLPFHPVPFITVTPSVTWTTLMGDAKDAVADSEEMLFSGKTDAFYWGLSAMFKF